MAKSSEALEALQQKIGYAFTRPEWLIQALTHSAENGGNNQRLEFLGDAVLGAVVSKKLYEDHPDWDEGDLSVARTALVCKDHLALVARALEIGSVLIIRKDVARSGPVHAMPAVLADALEALVGAVFVDGGYEAAFQMVCRVVIQYQRDRTMEEGGSPSEAIPPSKDAKTRLQEWLHAKSLPLPIYTLIRTEGPPNDCTFYAECRITHRSLTAHGEGRSRKAAEQFAASEVLAQLQRESP